MKYIKLFEQFIKEEAMKPNTDSKVLADDIKLENGETISSAEIIGAIINSETEKELEDFFYNKYGENAFKQGELANIKQLWNEYKAEQEEESSKEDDKKEGDKEGDAEDVLAGL